MPNDQLPLVSGVVDHRRSIADFFCGQRAPNFLASIFVESHRSATVAANQANDFVSIHERMRSKTPQWRFRSEIFFEITCPNHFAGGRVETEEISLGAKGINFTCIDDWRRARARWIAHRVWTIIFVLPQNSSVGLIQA